MGRQRSDRPVFPDEGGRAVELNRPFDRHQSQGRCATVSVLHIARIRSSSRYTGRSCDTAEHNLLLDPVLFRIRRKPGTTRLPTGSGARAGCRRRVLRETSRARGGPASRRSARRQAPECPAGGDPLTPAGWSLVGHSGSPSHSGRRGPADEQAFCVGDGDRQNGRTAGCAARAWPLGVSGWVRSLPR